jgi:hypothetical protein
MLLFVMITGKVIEEIDMYHEIENRKIKEIFEKSFRC